AVSQSRARGRGEPRAGEGAVRAARGDGRAADHGRLRDVPAPPPLHGDGDAEPDRAGGHVSAARGPARSLPAARARRLPGRRGRAGGLFGSPDPLTQDEVLAARRAVLDLYLAEPLEEYIVQIVLATRDPARYGNDLAGVLQYGASPRATIALDRCSRARAWLA